MPRKKKNLNAEPGEISAEERAKLDKEIEANLPEDIPEEENGRVDCPDTEPGEAPEEGTEEAKPEAEAKDIEVKGEPSFTKIIKERFFHEFNEADLAEINGKIVEELELQKAFAEERAAVAAKIKRSNDEINELLELKEKGGEERVFDCEVRYYCNLGNKYIIHPEKGYVVRCEPISLEEREQDLPFSGGKECEEKPEAPEAEDGEENGFDDPDLNPEAEE